MIDRYNYSKTAKSYGKNINMEIKSLLRGLFELKAESHYNGIDYPECSK